MASKTEEKKEAHRLFVYGGLNLKEISKLYGVSPTTLSKWNKDENWETQRAAQKVTRESLIQQYYTMLANINKKVFDDKNGIPDATDTDKMSKIQASISAMDKNYDLAAYYSVLSELVEIISNINNDHAKLLGGYMLEFMKEKAKKLK
ncbi:MAG TPA: DUF1804 family protein [Chitinophagales bacterium]|nr:DUF1804 family protein [Chitinophagales bacterium]